MKLTKEKEQIFESQYIRIYEEGKKRYQNDEEFEDLLQILFSGYRVALQKANLSQNYHAYCMRNAHWECYKEFNKRTKRNHHQCLVENLDLLSEYGGAHVSPVSDVTIEEQVSFDASLTKFAELYKDLSSSDLSVIDHCVFGIGNEKPEVKIRRQQMVVKAFREAAKELFNVA
jgi:hypothetical protein